MTRAAVLIKVAASSAPTATSLSLASSISASGARRSRRSHRYAATEEAPTSYAHSRGETRLPFGITLARAHQCADATHPFAQLRPRDRRPRNHRAAKKPNDLTPPKACHRLSPAPGVTTITFPTPRIQSIRWTQRDAGGWEVLGAVVNCSDELLPAHAQPCARIPG